MWATVSIGLLWLVIDLHSTVSNVMDDYVTRYTINYLLKCIIWVSSWFAHHLRSRDPEGALVSMVSSFSAQSVRVLFLVALCVLVWMRWLYVELGYFRIFSPSQLLGFANPDSFSYINRVSGLGNYFRPQLWLLRIYINRSETRSNSTWYECNSIGLYIMN